MATRLRNLARGGATKAARSQIEGVKELEAKFRDLIGFFQSRYRLSAHATALKREITHALFTAGEMVAADARSNAATQNVPERVRSAIFTSANPAKDKPGRSAALIGVNKKRSMMEWVATTKPKSARAKQAPGRKVSMSLAAMFEQGTTRMEKRSYFTPAWNAQRMRALEYIINSYKTILEKFNDIQ